MARWPEWGCRCLNLRAAPKDGPVHEWLNRVWEQRESIPQYFSVNPLQAFDALFFIDQISPVQVERNRNRALNVWVANYYSARQSVEIIKFGDPGSGR